MSRRSGKRKRAREKALRRISHAIHNEEIGDPKQDAVDNEAKKPGASVLEVFSNSTPFSIIRSILAVLGLLAVIDQLNLVKLKGFLLDWIDAYRSAVALIVNVFSWFKWDWIALDSLEAALIPVLFVPISSFCRAQANHRYPGGAPPGTLFTMQTMSSLLVLFAYVLLPFLILPGYWGATVSVFLVSLMAYASLGKERQVVEFMGEKRTFAEREAVLAEVLIVISCLAIGLIVNSVLQS